MIALTRRQLLALGLTGAGAVAVGGAGLWWTNTGGAGFTTGADLAEPQALSSSGGRLDVALEAAPTRLRVGGRTANAWTFNGTLPGPTLRLRPGDTLGVTLRNGLRDATNLHVHGLHVSPQGNGDNPFVRIGPGETFGYRYAIPEGHPPGTYWYHPHHHGMAAEQVAAGLYGAIVIEDPGTVPVSRDRVLVVSDLALDATGNLAAVSPPERMMGREGALVLVNGQVVPQASAAPGERERWRLVNACPSRFLRLRLDGQQVRLLARDGRRLRVPEEITEVDLAPGNRADLIVEARTGNAVLRTLPVDRGGMDGMMGHMEDGRSGTTEPLDLMSFNVAGPPVQAMLPIPEGIGLRDLRYETLAARRTLTFAMGMAGMMGGGMGAFTINGREFDPDRLDETVRSGSVEEWTLVNSSPMDHPIHLHVWPMQVVQDASRNLSEPTWQDVVIVPAFGQVKVLIAFDGFSGRTVFHCHILDHEDLGMMGTIEAR